MQKLIVGFLILTVIGAAGIGVYEANQTDEAQPVEVTANAVDASAAASAPEAPAAVQDPDPVPGNGNGNSNGSGAADGAGPLEQQTQQDEFVNNIGDPWTGSGTVTGFDTAGMFVTLDDGSEVYVELGPSFYWEPLTTFGVGDWVSITGFFNGEQIHAVTVTAPDGSVLQVRTDAGEPLWSGGAQNGNAGQNGQSGNAGQNGSAGQSTGTGIPLTQVDPEDWVTLTGTVTEVTGSTLTVETTTDGTLVLSLGQPRFWEDQGVTFAVGDEVNILGYWQVDTSDLGLGQTTATGTFRAGEITKLATGERLMLLDPNGRPLWGGPGRSGTSNANSSGGGNATGGQGQSQDGQGQSQGGQGQGGSSQGGSGGRGYRGGR